jgi:phage-related protein
MGAQAIATGALSVATGAWSVVSSIAAAATTAFGAAMAFLTSPITLVILAIGALVAAAYLIIKNWDKISEFFKGLWENIKNIFSGIGSWFSDKFSAAKDAIVNIFTGVIDWVKTNWQSIVLFLINPFAGVFKYLYDNFEGFRNLVDNVVGAIINFFKGGVEKIKVFFGGIGEFFSGVWGGIKNAAGNAWSGIKNIASNAWEGIKGAASGAFNFLDNLTGGTLTKMKDNFLNGINNIKEFFTGLWSALKEGPAATIQYLKDTFFRLFDSIKEKLTAFVDFFKNAISGVKDFFGGIGDKIGGLFNGGRNNNVPGHASGGIFTQPHIAQIAEAGAEAVVPLNRSPQGFDIWKQAGELGGYVDRMNQQTQTTSTSGTPPVMEAAAQKISNNENVITINFSQNNTFSGGTPDKETVNQISAAGKQAADDIEVRFKILMEDFMRNQRRVSYA